ncbi:MAG: MBL fold metallo-hydrolase [Lachnospiraceae bacterium]|nr:MBL fold metallo-hydrolase [Lachnospiraceae bacterium]
MALGRAGANCYFAYNKDSKECVIIDAPGEEDRIIEELTKLSLTPVAILLTHSHFDHIGAIKGLREFYHMPVYCHETEAELLETPALNLTALVGIGYGLKANNTLKDEEIVELAGIRIKTMHTPGHTSGCACYYLEEEGILFSGDTLFAESVGRTDFPTGSSNELVDSIVNKLFTLPDETTVYPGHNESTTIAHEKQYNRYVR